uniref:Uncharacterized protein LOC114328843 n=1 Tax=Diabrotica virgifera virgifera TaxID=50390 RepID=A0A6P7FFD1_DIAVI
MSSSGKNKRQLGLDSFFSKKPKVDHADSQPENQTTANSNILVKEANIFGDKESGTDRSASGLLVSTCNLSVRDFGRLLKNGDVTPSLLTDEEKFQWVKNPWVPCQSFIFPMVSEGKKNRSFQKSWLQTHE